MAHRGLRSFSGVALIALFGILGLMLASCESTYDGERRAARDPSRGGDPSSGGDPAPLSTGAQRGRQLFQQVGCLGCHTVHGEGGTIGPDLSNEGDAGHSTQWLRTQIRHPKSHDPQTTMPAFDNLSSPQVRDLVDYLESLKAGQTRAGPSGRAPAPETGARRPGARGTISVTTKGGELWGQICGQCHNLRSPAEYSDAQWAVAVHHMRVRVPLTGPAQQEILAFLQASN
jgi:mono/diheme cytochrome c family protein